jgi:membrane fusion protein (multidrug efflux system)
MFELLEFRRVVGLLDRHWQCSCATIGTRLDTGLAELSPTEWAKSLREEAIACEVCANAGLFVLRPGLISRQGSVIGERGRRGVAAANLEGEIHNARFAVRSIILSPAVVVAPVISKSVATTVEYVGRTQANRVVDLRARVTGFLLERPFKEGQHVGQGDLLYKIDPAEFQAAVDAARAAVTRAEAILLEAEQNLERNRILAERKTVSEASLDKAIAAEGQARADVDSAKAALATEELNLGYTEITTPIDGRIGSSAVDVGNLIGPDSGVLATVVDVDPIEVAFAITERELLDHRLRRAEGETKVYTPRLRLANGTVLEEEGEITYLDNQVDPATGTVALHVEFPNADELVLPGEFVNVILVSQDPVDRIVVSQAAVLTNQAGPFVLVVDAGDTVEARPVALGARVGVDVVVEEGLTAGEMVIIEGIQKVRPGAKVTPAPVAGS